MLQHSNHILTDVLSIFEGKIRKKKELNKIMYAQCLISITIAVEMPVRHNSPVHNPRKGAMQYIKEERS